MSTTTAFPRSPCDLVASELSLRDLENVAGGGLLHFIRAIVIPGTAEAGGSGSTDSNITTHTQVWVTTAS